jgi:PAS domain S-box-containing protein
MSEPFLLAIVGLISILTTGSCGACAALWRKCDKLQTAEADCRVRCAEIDSELKMLKQQVSILQAQHQYSDGPMMCIDPHGKIVVWNKEISELLGWSRDDMLGKNYIDTVPEKHRTFHHRAFKDLIDSHRTEYDHTVSGRALTAAGTELPVTIRVTMYNLYEITTILRVKMERRIPFEHDSDTFK